MAIGWLHELFHTASCLGMIFILFFDSFLLLRIHVGCYSTFWRNLRFEMTSLEKDNFDRRRESLSSSIMSSLLNKCLFKLLPWPSILCHSLAYLISEFHLILPPFLWSFSYCVWFTLASNQTSFCAIDYPFFSLWVLLTSILIA